MKIPAKGKVWIVPHPASLLACNARFLLGCHRCQTTCGSADPCKCCSHYKSRSAGGTTVYFPDDGLGHEQLLPMADFRAMAQTELV